MPDEHVCESATLWPLAAPSHGLGHHDLRSLAAHQRYLQERVMSLSKLARPLQQMSSRIKCTNISRLLIDRARAVHGPKVLERKAQKNADGQIHVTRKTLEA